MASSKSSVSVFLIFNPRMSLKAMLGFCLKLMFSSSCFHLVCCSGWISLVSYLLSVCVMVMTAGVEKTSLRRFLIRSFFLMSLLKPWPGVHGKVGWVNRYDSNL